MSGDGFSFDGGNFNTRKYWDSRYQIAHPQPQSFRDDDGKDKAVLEWAGGQSTVFVEAPSPILMGFTVEWTEDKGRRETETVKIENKDDSSQFVEVERIKKTVFKNNVTGEEFPVGMNWD